jgi:glutamine amidotransferase
VRFAAGELKVPHMGWNSLRNTAGPLYKGFPAEVSMYFVHSYYPVPADEEIISAQCDYGIPFAAGVSRGALHAVQFHPEKSQAAGLALLRNFLSTL